MAFTFSSDDQIDVMSDPVGSLTSHATAPHTPGDKRKHCPGCGRLVDLRWDGQWCKQHCAALAASRMLQVTANQPVLYCRVCGTQGCLRQ